MKISKVNNIRGFFLIRYLIIIFICFLTLFISGRIADMTYLLGWIENYNAGGTSTVLAINIFSKIGGFGNEYLLVVLLGMFFSLIIYHLLKNFIDKTNFNIWISILLIPGVLIYTSVPTKETLFFYPAIILIILECNFLTSNKYFNLPQFLIKTSLMFLMVILRGYQAIPYILFSIIALFLKNINPGEINKNLKITNLLVISFSLSLLVNVILNSFFPQFIENASRYLVNSLVVKNNIYRPNEFTFYREPLKIITMQYLSLFPTIGELLQKPYKLLITIDSILIIYSFTKSWKKLFNFVDPYKRLKKFVLLMFIYVSIIYFSFYGLIGSLNLGSSQRFRVNYIPLAIILPLILEKKLRDKETNLSLKSR